MEEQTSNRFYIALSFPGEHRDFVLKVAEELAKKLTRDCVFYDEWYEIELLGTGGDLKLQSMYEQADMIVPFFSEHYSKPWCSLEWETIRGILLCQRKEDKVIPVHLDDTDIPGWSAVDLGIRLRGRTPQEIADIILKALDKRISLPPETITPSPEPEQGVKLQLFEFDVVTLNTQGQEIKRNRCQNVCFEENLGNEIVLEMVWIQGGTFQMGSPEGEGYDDEHPQHEVTVKSFFMGKYPITQAQWRVVASLPKVERDLKPDPSNFKGDNHPVEKVSWYDAVEFCKRLSRQTRREYRLPSEAEWEYACRARTTTLFHFGPKITRQVVNCKRNLGMVFIGLFGIGETTEVGSFKVANSFGLYDVHGNVEEWCADTWHGNYEGAPDDGSAWTENGDDNCYLRRGGSWFSGPTLSRSAYRYFNTRDFRHYYLGFRVVCVAPRTT